VWEIPHNNRWADTEEKILVELFGENEDKLRYKALSSPASLTVQGTKRRQRQNATTVQEQIGKFDKEV